MECVFFKMHYFIFKLYEVIRTRMDCLLVCRYFSIHIYNFYNIQSALCFLLNSRLFIFYPVTESVINACYQCRHTEATMKTPVVAIKKKNEQIADESHKQRNGNSRNNINSLSEQKVDKRRICTTIRQGIVKLIWASQLLELKNY